MVVPSPRLIVKALISVLSFDTVFARIVDHFCCYPCWANNTTHVGLKRGVAGDGLAALWEEEPIIVVHSLMPLSAQAVHECCELPDSNDLA